MQSQPQQSTTLDLSKMQTIAQISNGFLHKFGTQNVRQIVDICQCQILQYASTQATQVPTHYLRVSQLVQRMDDTLFVLAKFQNLITYIFQCKDSPNSLYLLSFEIYNPSLQSFTQVFKQSTQVVQYKTDNYQKTNVRQKLASIIQGDLTQQMIESVGQFSSVIKTVGSILGSVAKSAADPAKKAQIIMNTGFQTISQKYISQQNKNRWNLIKQGASNINEKVTEIYKPIDNAFKSVVQYIGQNFTKSENKYIKNIKKLGLATAATLNNSYKRAQKNILGGGDHAGKQNNQHSVPQLHEQSTNNLAA